VLDALLAGLRWAAAEEPEAPSTVLNACRAARFTLHGDWLSKGDAGRWAIESGSDPRLAELALEARKLKGSDPLKIRLKGSDPLKILPADRVALFVGEVAELVEGAR
jgi:hypothetical protein